MLLERPLLRVYRNRNSNPHVNPRPFAASVIDCLLVIATGSNPGSPATRSETKRKLFRVVPSGCHGNALPPVMKPVANLDKDFAGIQIVRSAKGEAVVQQNAAVCYVYCLDVRGKLLAEAFADGEVECGMRLEMIAGDGWIAVREARGIVNVSRCIASPGQSVLTADVQGVALIVIQQLESVPERKVREAAADVSETEGQLI